MAKPQVTWPELLSFHLAVRTHAPLTAAHLPDGASATRPPEVLLLGDAAGRLYVFDWQGSILQEQSNEGGFGALTALHAVRMRCGDMPAVVSRSTSAPSCKLIAKPAES